MIHFSKKQKVCSTIFLAFVFLISTAACAGNDSVLIFEPAVLVVSGKTVEIPYVMKIDSQEISLDEYRYHFLNAKYTMDQGDDAYWDTDTNGSQQRTLKYQAESALKDSYAIAALAQDHNLSLTKEETDQIEADVKSQIETLGGTAQYKQALEDSFLTDDLYRMIWRTSYQYEKLYNYYFAQDGEFHNADTAMDNEAKETGYQIKLQAIIAEKSDTLTVEYGPEYELIQVNTLY